MKGGTKNIHPWYEVHAHHFKRLDTTLVCNQVIIEVCITQHLEEYSRHHIERPHQTMHIWLRERVAHVVPEHIIIQNVSEWAWFPGILKLARNARN